MLPIPVNAPNAIVMALAPLGGCLGNGFTLGNPIGGNPIDAPITDHLG
jgi:hypothetical protein